MIVLAGIAAGVISALQFGPVMSSAMSGGSMTTTTPLTPSSGAYTRIDSVDTASYGPAGGGAPITAWSQDGSV